MRSREAIPLNLPGSAEERGGIPAGTRLEHRCGDAGLPAVELLRLLKAAFGGDDAPPWPANQRWLLWAGDKLVGHASVQRRWFVVSKRYFEGWHVGGVCTDPSVQRRGIGTLLMRQANADLARQELDFAVLNCGPELVGFYARVGYSRIADCGLYIRDGTLARDEHPAMAISLRSGFDVAALTCEAFPFGFDF